MNKRLIAALCLILSALVIGTLSYLYLKNTSEKIIGIAKVIDEKNFGGEDFSGEYNELDALWKKHSKIYAMMLKHSDADTLDRYFIMLDDAVKNSNKNRITVIISELCAFIGVTVHGEAPRAENIF